MSDSIEIRGLSVETVVGVYDWERRVRQSLELDVEIDCDLGPGGASDRVEDTVDYKDLSTRIREHLQASRYRLIEALAADAVEICLDDPRVEAARVLVRKPGALRHARSVAVRVRRKRGDPPARAPHVAYVGLGSNVDPVEHVRAAVERLHERFGAIRVSPVYRTAPVGCEGAPDFLNLVVALRTDLGPRDLCDWLRATETQCGRERDADPNSPRTLDLDLLLYDEEASDEEGLRLPHPQIATAPFVLVPLAALAAGVPHPTTGVTIGEMRDRLPVDVPGIRLIDEVVF